MEVTRYYIEANINKPCKMAFVSDLHDCDNDPIIEIIKREDVDAVLVGGDFCVYRSSGAPRPPRLSIDSALI